MALEKRQAGGWWVDDLLRPALIAGMLACLMAPLIRILEWVFKGWDGTYVLFFAFFAGMEGILSERALQRRGITGYGYLVSRGAELLILLLLLKFLGYIPLGFDRLWADILYWSAAPNQFLTNLDGFVSVMFLLLWVGAIHVGRVVRELDVEERRDEPPPDKTSAEYYLWLTRPLPLSDRQQVFDWLGELFVWGGILILLASAAIHFLISPVEAPLLPTLLYFALGIALMSQGQFSLLRNRWQIQRIPIQQGVGRRWLLWAIVFIAAVGLIASLLPTRYSMGPLRILLVFLSFLFSLVSFLIFTFLFLITLPLALLLPQVEMPDAPRLPQAPVPPPEVTTGGGLPPWLEILLSAIFWLVVLAIVSYTLFRFFRDRFGSLPDEEGVEQSRWVRFLTWLQDLWHRWRIWRQKVQARLEQQRATRRERRLEAGPPFRFFFPGRLPPRELIRYFYLSTTRRAAQAGQSRSPGQTPYEYQDTLDERFPELEPDLTGLTDSFVKARYSQDPVESQDAQRVKPLWQRIRAELRRRRSGRQ